MPTVNYIYELLVICAIPNIASLMIVNKFNGSCVHVEQTFHTFDTACTSCHINAFTDCPDGTEKVTTLLGTPNCTYEQSFGIGPNVTKDGCHHTCRQEVNETSCCPGYWGSHCDECPGGDGISCNGHGDCSDGKNGTGMCTCFELWSGYSCESCTNSSLVYPNCTDIIQPACNLTCPNNSRCAEISGESTCMCDWPYYGKQDDDDEGSLTCREVDFCIIPPLCHTNASCAANNETGEKNCTCNQDFHGDGYDCDITDPCQVDNGGCDPNSTTCKFISPGKSTCECKVGYFEYVPNYGCSLIDVCQKVTCHHRAKCATISPYTTRCTCLEGYVGDGHNCMGTILQTLSDLDAFDPDVKGQLNLIHTAMDTFFRKELTESSAITVFVSINTGFRYIRGVDFQKWLSNKHVVKTLLRQQILVGDFMLEYLQNQTTFYTLDGASAELNIVNKRRNILGFTISGSRRQARILKGDIVASNGVIHITKQFLVDSIGDIGNEQMTADNYIASMHAFSTFNQLIELAGDRIKPLLQQHGITVLAPPNEAWDKLPWDSENIDDVEVILKNHILNKTYEVTDFFNVRRLKSAAGYIISIGEENGRFNLNEDAHITKADIVVENGLMMMIDAVILPDGISTLPNFCNDFSYNVTKGPCGDCRDELKCLPADNKTDLIESCEYFARTAEGQYEKYTGCAPLCNRTFTIQQCCNGFYGLDCLPCPGGYRNPCHGHGVCNKNTGECSCDANFDGEDCSKCKAKNHFGPNCTQECTCVKGFCNDGPLGDGTCRACIHDSPLLHVIGENCDKYFYPCGHKDNHCHVHAICIEISRRNKKCICEEGYTGDGESFCNEIDPCLAADYGGCHRQATCMRIGLGQNNCTCNQGWSGDGSYCYPASTCRNHSNCHENAACVETFPGSHVCRCHDGYHGDGISWCVFDDMCALNNGGCHSKAKCINTEPGRVNCTCMVHEGYSGNGYSCHGNMIQTIMDNKNLTWMARLLSSFTQLDKELLLDDNYTVFAPHDEAVLAFQASHIMNETIHQWMNKVVLLSLLNYHTLLNATRLDKLVVLSQFRRLETMEDGYYLHLERLNDETVEIYPMVDGPVGKVLESDIIATNGYLNIIDQILLPVLPTDPRDYPDLETFFKLHPKYSIFGDWLMKKNLTTYLEDSYLEYTLFVPPNDAMKHVKHTITREYLMYYIVNMKVLLATYGNGTLPTALGAGHQLDLMIYDWFNVTINGVPIVEQNMNTFGGVVNGLAGLLHPVLHRCREISQTVRYGPCDVCSDRYPCERGWGFRPLLSNNGSVMTCIFERYDVGFRGKRVELDGCQGLCYKNRSRLGCCAGYYGTNCAECPGGPEFPCSGHGQCDDGNQGTGLCTCDKGFTGYSCDSCAEGWTGNNCDTDMTSCSYNNGGCDGDAICTHVDGKPNNCVCPEGFLGDGYTCTGPCDDNNGGCHSRAKCSFQASSGVTCVCKSPFVGDGKTACNADIFSTLLTMNGVSVFLKTMNQFADEPFVTGLKNSSVVGKFTLFVPVDSGLSYPIPTRDQFLQQIVQGNVSLLLKHGLFLRQSFTSMAGDTLVATFEPETNNFFVNETSVVKGNIPCTNGIIHLMAAPFTPLVDRTVPESSTDSGVGATVGVSIAAAVLFISLVIGGILYLMKHSSRNYWKILHDWRSKQEPEGASQVEPLHVDDGVDELAHNDTTFGNPLYLEQNLG